MFERYTEKSRRAIFFARYEASQTGCREIGTGHLLLGISSGHDLGFRFIFGSAALWFILGTVMVSRIRGVR